MVSELGRRTVQGGNEGSFGELEKEIGNLLCDQWRQESDDHDHDHELNMYRSGSAPPTVEGSLNAVGGLFTGSGGAGNIAFLELAAAKNGNGFVSEEELRSDPSYLSYYYTNVNLNPRLPPPLLSKEDWRYAQRMKGGSSALGGIGDRRKVNRVDTSCGQSPLFSTPPRFDSRSIESEAELEKVSGSVEWAGEGLIGLPGLGVSSKQKMLTEILKDDLGHASSFTGHPSRPGSRNAFDENAGSVGSVEAKLAHLQRELTSVDTLQSVGNGHGSSVVHTNAPPSSYTYAAALGASLSRSASPDPQLIARVPSPCIPPIGVGRVGTSEKRGPSTRNSFNGVLSGISDSTDLVDALSGINLSGDNVIDENKHAQSQIKQHTYLKKSESEHLQMPSVPNSANIPYSDSGMTNEGGSDFNSLSLISDRHNELKKSALPSSNSYLKGSPTSTLSGGVSFPAQHQHVDSTNSPYARHGLSGYSINPAFASMMASQLGTGNLPPMLENVAASAMSFPGMNSRVFGGGLASGPNMAAVASESHNLTRMGNQFAGITLQAPYVDPLYLQYLRTSDYAASQLASFNDPSLDRNYFGNPNMNILELQKAYHGALLSPHKSQYSVPFGSKSGGSTPHGYYGNPAFGIGMSYPGSPLVSPVIPNSPHGPGSPIRHNEFNMRFPSGMRNLAGGVMGPWHSDSGFNMSESFTSSLLEEFKSNKTKSYELSEIFGHVVDFSADQFGSRFIQQKLETASIEEKDMIYQEIMPQAVTLMTDVFGNYVIQKFFEHGLASQRRELASKLFSHVLTLSLQMYGCRVIQKAIEVVDLDQKTKMVEELDGHVLRCVRDQNGNHVIQKCIECVPEDAIQFIISTFYGQVVTLSTHAYGCRVIQRVLEHCEDPKTQSKVMDEILGSVSMLAQDQYGNYVIQHVLEHGKAHERSAIVKELAGRIVQMSQQKFASNVVEKCLTFSGPAERQLLIREMLGTTDENEPLQAMMKDQFANYVVQKVLETCDDQQRELILSRIKVHSNAINKYTYGKHVVARVEKLVTAGERRIAAQSSHQS